MDSLPILDPEPNSLEETKLLDFLVSMRVELDEESEECVLRSLEEMKFLLQEKNASVESLEYVLLLSLICKELWKHLPKSR
jgi:hypothetical protein